MTFQEVVNNPQVQAGVAFLLSEMVMRFKKTEKPVSWLHVAAAFAHKLAKVLEDSATLLDKVLPQKIKETDL